MNPEPHLSRRSRRRRYRSGMLTAEKQHAALVPAGIAAALAAGAAALLQSVALATHAADGVAEALWLLGWGLACCAAIATAAAVAMLWRHRAQPHGFPLASTALVAAAVALLALTAWLHPFVGSGSGTG